MPHYEIQPVKNFQSNENLMHNGRTQKLGPSLRMLRYKTMDAHFLSQGKLVGTKL
jgi:hypothetical protein